MQSEQNVWLFANTNTPTPSEILIPDLYLGDSQLMPEDVIVCAISSRNARNYFAFHFHTFRATNCINSLHSGRHSDFGVIQSHRNNQIPLIPESPPPAYTQQPNPLFLMPNSKPFDATNSRKLIPSNEINVPLSTFKSF